MPGMGKGESNRWPPGFEPKVFATKRLAGQVMAAGAESASHMVDTFSSWMLGGFGAVMALLLANIPKLSPVIPIATFRRAGEIYIVAAALGVIEKFLALWIGGMSKAEAVGADLGKDIDPANFDMALYLETVKKGFYWPGRWLVNRFIAAFARGDIAYASRVALKATQWQGLIAVIEAGLVTISAAVIVSAL